MAKSKEETYQYRNDFNRNKYDRISLVVPKGNKEELQAHAQEMGESVNAFINRAIRETMARDKTSE